jgi:outer membrane protein TolC
MTLDDLVGVALRQNFGLITSARDVEIARSQATASEAFFMPFIDLVASERVTYTRDGEVPLPATPDPLNPLGPGTPGGTTTSENIDERTEAGVEVRQNLPTGGSITASGTSGRSKVYPQNDVAGETNRSDYDSRADVRFIQPLLRGGGLEVGTADLRRSRLGEMDTLLRDRIAQRDTVRTVIARYFVLLQLKQQLLVSRDAIKERFRFLEETALKYEMGRVAESENLRAEIQFLQELQTAIDRRQRLDDAREELLLTLGLPLDTPISLVDITPELLVRGRVDIPPVEEAVRLALDNRIELMTADISLVLAEISQRVSRNDVLPDLNLDAGFLTTDAGGTLDDTGDFPDQTWDAGLEFRFPLQNIQRREAHRQNLLRLRNAETERLNIERNLVQEVYSRHRAVLTNEARLTILRRTVEQARRNLELINASFEVGFASITEVRLAQDDLFDSETRYKNDLLNYQIAIADLYVALGLPLY